jgi:isoleucyl-tRNA synthetase
LVVGKKINYVKIRTFNKYTGACICRVSEDLISKHFKAEGENASFQDYKLGDKVIPWELAAEFVGEELAVCAMEQLFAYITNDLQENGSALFQA